MLFKGKRKYFIILALVFVIIYLFVAAEPIEQGVYFKPLWISSIDNVSTKESSADVSNIGKDQKVFPFVLGKRFGYFSPDGKILRNLLTEDQVSISSEFWTSYPKLAVNTNIYSFISSDKSPKFTIKESGYVYLDDSRIYLFEPDGCTISKFDDSTGRKLWRYIHAAPVTAFQSSSSATIIGYSDGKLVCLDNSGKILFDFYPGGSNYEVIMGAAISEDGTKALCVCGLEQQRVVLIEIEDNHHKIIYHSFFKSDLRRQLFVDFESNANFAVFESGDGIGILDCNSFETFFINEPGKLIALGEKMHNRVLTMLVQNDSSNTLLAISPPKGLIGKTTFKAKNTFLIQDDDRVYLGSDSKILGLKIALEIGD